MNTSNNDTTNIDNNNNNTNSTDQPSHLTQRSPQKFHHHSINSSTTSPTTSPMKSNHHHHRSLHVDEFEETQLAHSLKLSQNHQNPHHSTLHSLSSSDHGHHHQHHHHHHQPSLTKEIPRSPKSPKSPFIIHNNNMNINMNNSSNSNVRLSSSLTGSSNSNDNEMMIIDNYTYTPGNIRSDWHTPVRKKLKFTNEAASPSSSPSPPKTSLSTTTTTTTTTSNIKLDENMDHQKIQNLLMKSDDGDMMRVNNDQVVSTTTSSPSQLMKKKNLVKNLMNDPLLISTMMNQHQQHEQQQYEMGQSSSTSSDMNISPTYSSSNSSLMAQSSGVTPTFSALTMMDSENNTMILPFSNTTITSSTTSTSDDDSTRTTTITTTTIDDHDDHHMEHDAQQQLEQQQHEKMDHRAMTMTDEEQQQQQQSTSNFEQIEKTKEGNEEEKVGNDGEENDAVPRGSLADKIPKFYFPKHSFSPLVMKHQQQQNLQQQISQQQNLQNLSFSSNVASGSSGRVLLGSGNVSVSGGSRYEILDAKRLVEMRMVLRNVRRLFAEFGDEMNCENFEEVCQVMQVPEIFSLVFFGNDDQKILSWREFEPYVVGCLIFYLFFNEYLLPNSPMTRLFHMIRNPVFNPAAKHRSYLIPADFEPLLESLLETHEGLSFLQSTPAFQQKYSQTVILRIFFACTGHLLRCCCSSNSGNSDSNESSGSSGSSESGGGGIGSNSSEISKMKMIIHHREFIHRRIGQVLLSLPDIDNFPNGETHFFSYEQFYVIYVHFWELDTQHTFQIKLNQMGFTEYCMRRIRSELGVSSSSSANKSSGEKSEKRGNVSAGDLIIDYNNFVQLFLAVNDPSDCYGSFEFWWELFTPEKTGFIHLPTLKSFWNSLQRQIRIMEGSLSQGSDSESDYDSEDGENDENNVMSSSSESSSSSSSSSSTVSWSIIERQIKDLWNVTDLHNIPKSAVRRACVGSTGLGCNVFLMLSSVNGWMDMERTGGGVRKSFAEWAAGEYERLASGDEDNVEQEEEEDHDDDENEQQQHDHLEEEEDDEASMRHNSAFMEDVDIDDIGNDEDDDNDGEANDSVGQESNDHRNEHDSQRRREATAMTSDSAMHDIDDEEEDGMNTS